LIPLRGFETRNVVVGIGLAFALWYVVFLTHILDSFWYRVTIASIVLALYAAFLGRGVAGGDHEISVSMVLKGVVSGGFLYASFFVGYNVFRSSVESGASSVYLFRTDSPLYIAAVSLIITSLCEEFFWRRYLQTVLVESHGGTGLSLNALAYAFIHLPTGNLALVFAALIAGLFWGLLYEYTESFWAVVFSHIVWTELIFVFLPLG
jgi:membrane protease YdiL (CAAX protease family)